MALLGVNVDHVATVREARLTYEPDPVLAAGLAELGGADGITIHLREDRRHIQERDLRLLRQTVIVPLNLELAAEPDELRIACEVVPDQVTLVPERRQEVTTEGGLDVIGHRDQIADAVKRLRDAGIRVSLFVDPEQPQLVASGEVQADAVELHTGAYAIAKGDERQRQLERLSTAAESVRSLGLTLNAGHGLNYHNVRPVANLEGMCELNIGHSIVARAVMVGITTAVREMKQQISS